MRALGSITADEIRGIQKKYEATGQAAIDDVALPGGCHPHSSQVVFVDLGDAVCRALLPTGVRYAGNDPALQAIFASEPVGGQAYELASDVRGVAELLAKVDALFGRTPHPGPAAPADVGPYSARRNEEGRHQTLTPAELAQVDALLSGCTADVLVVTAEQIFDGLARTVLGQDQRLWTLAERLAGKLARTSHTRPWSAALCGPTGVGKTESAEAISRVLGDVLPDSRRYAYTRIDCSELSEAHSVSRLLGAPQGYAGYQDGAVLVDALRASPRHVLLFDEIEKAHPAVWRTLMNLLDAGRLLASRAEYGSRELSCPEALILFTSNLDCAGMVEELDARPNDDALAEDEVCRRRLIAGGMPPEFVGRINSCLVYRPLPVAARAEIVARAIMGLAESFGISVRHVSPNLVATIIRAHEGGALGARMDSYTVERLVTPALLAARQRGLSGACDLIHGPPIQCVAL